MLPHQGYLTPQERTTSSIINLTWPQQQHNPGLCNEKPRSVWAIAWTSVKFTAYKNKKFLWSLLMYSLLSLVQLTLKVSKLKILIFKTLKCTYVFVIFHTTCVNLIWPSSGVLICLAKFLHCYTFSLTLFIILLFNLKFWSIISLLSTACIGDWYISFCCVLRRCCGKIIKALTFLQMPESISCHR